MPRRKWRRSIARIRMACSAQRALTRIFWRRALCAYPDGMFRAEGPYADFLEKREAFLEAQSEQQAALANKVRREVEWLRRGPKARTGKSKARIDAAHELMGELAEVSAR